MGCTRWKMLIVLLVLYKAAISQSVTTNTDSISPVRLIAMNPQTFRNNSNDTVWIYSGLCKTLKTTVLTGKEANPYLLPSLSRRTPFLTVHGNIQYDFLYRSIADTPFYQTDFRQHSVKTNLHLLLSNRYPLQVTILHRNSNSPYFRDITDVSVQFSQREYLRQIKDRLIQQTANSLQANHQLKLQEAQYQYNARLARIEALQQWLSSPARLQELTAENIRNIKDISLQKTEVSMSHPTVPPKNSLPELPSEDAIQKAISDKVNRRFNPDSDSVLALLENWALQKKRLIDDSISTTQTAFYIKQKTVELDSVRKEAAQYEKKLKTFQRNLNDSLSKIRQELSSIKNSTELNTFIRKKQLDAAVLPKGWQALSSIRTVGIGRSWIDYSELTVKNISVTGINVEANPGRFYFAAAGGRINYRFRDFVISNSYQPKQTLYLLRGGLGKIDGNNIIFTWYEGKKSLLQPAGSSSNSSRLEKVIGMSMETRLQLNEHHFVIAEFAKSSFQSPAAGSNGQSSLFDKVRNFNDRSNEAYSLRLSSQWPSAGTKLSGYYKRMGSHFQSFNLQPVNSSQEAFQVKLQQQLWQKKLQVDAGVRKNDFSNPFIQPGISSRTLFTSFQLGLRIPKYPFLTIGYSPTSQLSVLNNQRLVENQYNTLNAVLSYSYKTRQMRMVTNALFLKFYNHAHDTGFIYYNASSFSLQQFIYWNSWEFQSGVTITDQLAFRVLTLDQTASFQLKQWLSINGGVKYNRLSRQQEYWGATAGLNMHIARMGTLQLSYDKSYFPGTEFKLMPVETGRLSFYRSF